MDYYCETFECLEELAEEYEDLAEQLLDAFGEGEWENHVIRVYYSLSSFAEYQVHEGCYAGIMGFIPGSNYWQGLPSLFLFLNWKELGKELVSVLARIWGKPSYWTNGDVVVETEELW